MSSTAVPARRFETIPSTAFLRYENVCRAMRAAVFHGVGQALRIEDLPEPEPHDHQVVIKVGRCGICGTDIAMTSGHGATFETGSALGHEYAGEVVALGPNVERLRIGDRISAMPMSGCGRCGSCLAGRPIGCVSGMNMMMGGFGEFTLADERFAVRLPSSLTLADGALVEPLAAALRGVSMASLRRGDNVIILGAGAMGVGAAYWARRLGAGRIAVVARSKWRGSLALQMGATSFITDDVPADHVLDDLGGHADVAFECTGAPGALARTIDFVRLGGTVVCIGICAVADTFVPAIAVGKEICMRFSCAYTHDDFRFAVDTLTAGAVEPRAMVDRTIELSDVPNLLEAMRAGQRYGTKVLVNPNNLPSDASQTSNEGDLASGLTPDASSSPRTDARAS